jgi:glutathione S-transferase
VKRFNIGLYREHLERLQGLVAKADPWLFGARLGVADIYALVLFRWGGLAGIDPDSLPIYQAFVARVAAEPAVAAALAREGAPLNMYRKPA